MDNKYKIYYNLLNHCFQYCKNHMPHSLNHHLHPLNTEIPVFLLLNNLSEFHNKYKQILKIILHLKKTVFLIYVCKSDSDLIW